MFLKITKIFIIVFYHSKILQTNDYVDCSTSKFISWTINNSRFSLILSSHEAELQFADQN